MSKPPNWTFVTSKQVWMDKSLSIEAKGIWHILSAWRDIETGESYPTVWTLQQVSGLGRNKVESSIRELVNAKAITRRIERVRRKSGVCGSKAIYTVSKPSQWVAREIYKKPAELQFPGASESGGTREQHVSLSHPQSLNHPQSVTHPLSPVEPADRGFRFTEDECEAFLEVRGFGSGVAATVFGRLDEAGWLDANRKPFASQQQLEAYAAGLAQRIDDAKVGW